MRKQNPILDYQAPLEDPETENENAPISFTAVFNFWIAACFILIAIVFIAAAFIGR